MDITAFLGAISAFGLKGTAIVSRDDITIFVNLPFPVIVPGGTFGAAMKIATKTPGYTKGFIKNKSLVPLCLGGNNFHRVRARLAS